MEEHRTRQVMYQAMLQITHGDYAKMVPQWRDALRQDPDFFSRACVFIYNQTNITDQADVAVITLMQAPSDYADYREAGRCMLLGNGTYQTNVRVKGLPPFRILDVWDYIRRSDMKVPTILKSTMTDWIRAIEAVPAWLESVALYNRRRLKQVYKYHHIKPSPLAQAVLFDEKPPEGSKLAVLKQIAQSDDRNEQARLIIEHKIPDRIAASLLPADSPITLVARLAVKTPKEVLNSRKLYEESGILNIPEVREEFERKIERATASISVAEHRKSAQGTDERVQAAVERAKQKAIDQETHRIEKTTLFMGDASSSMDTYFPVMQQIGSRIMPICDGEFMCVLFNDHAQVLEVIGNTLADWQAAFRGKRASGWTNMQAGFELALRRGLMPDQVIIATDGGENRGTYVRNNVGSFAETLSRYADQNQMNPNVIVVGLKDTGGRYDNRFARSIQNKGFTVDEFPPPPGEYDYNLFDQIVAVCGGPPAVTLVQRVMETVLPERVQDEG